MLKTNSSLRFGFYLYDKNVLPLFKMLYLLGFYLSHNFGLISTQQLHHKGCKLFFSGQSYSILKALVKAFVSEKLTSMLNPQMIQRLDAARAAGQYTVILSGSPTFLIEEIARQLEVDEWAATEYSITTKRTVGTVTHQMDGEDKARYVQELMERLSIPKENVTGYTDSFLDYPFLQAVGHPVAVNPGRTLRKLCQHNHWDIVDTG